MNEQFLVRLVRGGTRLPIAALTPDGVVLGGEDTWPRELMLEFDARSSVTAFRMERVRALKGWLPWQFKLEAFVRGGGLAFTGVEPDALPAGDYWARLRLADTRVKGGRRRFTVPEGGSVELSFEVEGDPRRFALLAPPEELDPAILRVLQDPRSRADGLALAEWLADDDTRARRRACLMNVLAALRVAPSVSHPLVEQVRHVFFVDVDRAYAAVEWEMMDRLAALAADPARPFFDEGTPKSATHRKLLSRIEPLESDAHAFVLRSFRQEGGPSLQVTVAVPPGGDRSRPCYADLDIDLGNPLGDVAGFLVHFGELVDPGKTDHLALWKKLKGGKAAPFLGYKVATA